jgi:hypothetical protein
MALLLTRLCSGKWGRCRTYGVCYSPASLPNAEARSAELLRASDAPCEGTMARVTVTMAIAKRCQDPSLRSG